LAIDHTYIEQSVLPLPWFLENPGLIDSPVALDKCHFGREKSTSYHPIEFGNFGFGYDDAG
jgi:hypothetical protein